MTEPTPSRRASDRTNPRTWPQRALGYLLVGLALATVIVVAVQTARLNDATSCQAAYNEAYTEAIQARSEAARQERQAQRELLTTRPKTEADALAAMDKYLKALDKSDAVRDRAELPTRRC